jgi:hypothetical protein
MIPESLKNNTTQIFEDDINIQTLTGKDNTLIIAMNVRGKGG